MLSTIHWKCAPDYTSELFTPVVGITLLCALFAFAGFLILGLLDRTKRIICALSRGADDIIQNMFNLKDISISGVVYTYSFSECSRIMKPCAMLCILCAVINMSLFT